MGTSSASRREVLLTPLRHDDRGAAFGDVGYAVGVLTVGVGMVAPPHLDPIEGA